MPTQEHDSWLSALGVDFDKAKSWVNKEVDAVKDDVNKAEDWAKDEAKKGVDWVKTEADKAVDEVKKGADWVKTEAGKVAGAVKKDADAIKMKALGDQSGKPVPRPMEADCKPEHGYVPGPKNHLLCATHGHVLDTDQRMIIAESVATYAKQGVAAALKSVDVRAAIASSGAAQAPTNTQNVATSSGDPSGGLSPALLKQANDFLDAHHFHATKSEEVVPGDKTCDVWLDDHLVKQEEVRAALTKAITALADDPIGLAHLVSARWDDEIHQALVQSGSWPGVRKPPDGVLRRKRDGHIYWVPNPAPPTMGDAPQPAAPDDWVTGCLEFYDIEPTGNAADAGKACVFNGDPSTIVDVGKLLAAQALLAGYKPNASGSAIAIKLSGDRQVAQAAGDVVDRITKKVAAKQDLADEISALGQLDMAALLEALTRLHKAGLFETLADYGPKFSNRLGAAFFTVDANYGENWQQLLAKLGDDDRDTILARVPRENWPTGKSGGGGKADNGNVGWQKQFNGALQYALHYTITRKAVAKADPYQDATLQVAIAANYSGHKDNEKGPEFQTFIEFDYNMTTGQATKIVGVQGALVSAVWHRLQAQGFLKVAAGVASSGNTAQGTVQAQIGVQLLVTVGPVQIGLQGSPGVTYTAGSPIDLPLAGVLVIQGNF